MKTLEDIQGWLISQLADVAGMAPEEIDARESFDSYGLSSRDAVMLSGDLQDWLGRELPPTVVYDYPTVEALAAYLASGDASVLPEAAPVRVPVPDDAIAIVGMACRFPGAPNLDAFWAVLHDGIDAVTEVQPDRWDLESWYDEHPGAPGKMNTRRAAFIEGIDLFDAAFFGISPREASRMDPQQRLLLEVAWEAIEHAGVPPTALAGSNTATFIGICGSDYAQIQHGSASRADAYAGTGNAHSIAANRLSYFLDLKGPSLAVDAACASSLAAVHLACRSLAGGECDTALAGGVNVILAPEVSVALSQARMLAGDGKCKAFDAKADGYVRGEGCGVVMLKRLADATADGDTVHAIVRGTAVNHDGRTNGLTAPNSLAQQAVIRQALRRAGTAPADIGYVETQGVGSLLGDAIEVEALKTVLSDGRRPGHPCILGSVKTNIGHLEGAAGISALIKAVLVLTHGEIPRNLHFSELNPNIRLGGSELRPAIERRSWPASMPRIAGVNAFGFGGTNAHAVIEAIHLAPSESAEIRGDRPAHVLAISARSEFSLRELAGRYAALLGGGPSLADVAHGANTRRTHFDHRLAVVAHASPEAAAALSAYARGDAHSCELGVRPRNAIPRSSFVYGPDRALTPGAGGALFATLPWFRETIERCDGALRRFLAEPLIDVLYGPRRGFLDRGDYRHAARFALDCALTRSLHACGLRPAAVTGAGAGLLSALAAAGALSLEQGLKLACGLGRGIEDFEATVLKTTMAPLHIPAAIPGGIGFLGAGQVPMSAVLNEAARSQDDERAILASRGITDTAGIDAAMLDWPTLLRFVSRAYVAGAEIDWKELDAGASFRTVSLPSYPWDRQRYWVEPHPADAPVFAVGNFPPSRALLTRILDAPEGARVRLIEQELRRRFAAVLELDPSMLTGEASVVELGLDSIMVMELMGQLNAELLLDIRPRAFFNHPSIPGLANLVCEHLAEAAPGPVNDGPVSHRLVELEEGIV